MKKGLPESLTEREGEKTGDWNQSFFYFETCNVRFLVFSGTPCSVLYRTVVGALAQLQDQGVRGGRNFDMDPQKLQVGSWVSLIVLRYHTAKVDGANGRMIGKHKCRMEAWRFTLVSCAFRAHGKQ